MNPWWLRPPAEEKSGESERDESRPADDRDAEPEVAPEAGEAPVESSSEADSGEAPRRRTRRGSRGGARRRRVRGDEPRSSRAQPEEAAAEDGTADEGRDREQHGNGEAADDGDARPRRRRSRASRSRPRLRREPEPAPAPEPEPQPEPDDEPDTEPIEIMPPVSFVTSERNASVNDERKLALFCDTENVALGVRDSDIKKFDISLVLERLVEKGKVIVKKAYCDWERYSEFKRAFHEAGIEMIDIPQKRYSGKNSADIKMAVDAMEICYSKEHLDTFVLLSGDSDFSPLVSKLKEDNRHVIGVGVKNSTSNLLIDNCDEFLFYEDIWRDRGAAPKVGGDKKSSEVYNLMIDAIKALQRENKDVLWGSMIKQTMQRKKPSFNEGYYGFSTFSELLEDAERNKLIKLKKDQRSGTYIVTGFSSRR